jgi:hypothetical protein
MFLEKNLHSLSESELCDLLVKNTMELLDLNHKKSDHIMIFHKKADVELIQTVIKTRKSEKDPAVLCLA